MQKYAELNRDIIISEILKGMKLKAEEKFSSKDFHWKYFKKLLRENDLPDIRWHDFRSTYATMLLKENISPKAVSKTLGHAKEIITIDVYGDNKEIISGDIPELDRFIKDVLPRSEDKEAEIQVLDGSIAIDDYFESKN